MSEANVMPELTFMVTQPTPADDENTVIPAQAGIHEPVTRITCLWVPAYAGTTTWLYFTLKVGAGETAAHKPWTN